MLCPYSFFFFFFFNDTATTEIYTLSLHDALPISRGISYQDAPGRRAKGKAAERFAGLDPAGGDTGNRGNRGHDAGVRRDRKSTRLNSSHDQISYAVFCLKKKKNTKSKK